MTAPDFTAPAFAAGDVPDAGDLNTQRGLLANLYGWAVGGFRRNPRPIVSVRVTAENREAVSGVNYTVPWDSADVDTDDMWAAVSSDSLWVNTDGLWLLGFHARLVANVAVPSTASFHGWICVDGVNPQTDAIAAGTTGDAGPTVDVLTTARLYRGDRLRCVVNQNAGLTLGLPPDYATTRAWAVWLGP